LLITIILFVIFFVAGIIIYFARERGGIPFNLFVRLCLTSLGLSSSVGIILVPGTWLIISFSINDGLIKDNLYPGTTLESSAGFLVILLISVILARRMGIQIIHGALQFSINLKRIWLM